MRLWYETRTADLQRALGTTPETDPVWGGFNVATHCHYLNANGTRLAVWLTPDMAERVDNLTRTAPPLYCHCH